MSGLMFHERHALAPAARELLAAADPAFAGASLDVSDGDDMFRFHVLLATSASEAVLGYFGTAAAIQASMDLVVRWHFGSWDAVGSFLDFASGFGRSTRLLVRRLPADRVSVGEIQDAALRFQASTFGVQPVSSGVDGIELADDVVFDAVFVISLFSHLPADGFEAWLARLWDRVGPDGVLAFSTHRADHAPPDADLTTGLHFMPQNEIPSLDVHRYGTSFVTDEYVRGVVARVCGTEAAARVQRVEGLFGIQDLYVVARSERNPEPIAPPAPPVQGHLDGVTIDGSRVTVGGWALCASDVPAVTPAILATVDGAPVMASTGSRRADVADHFGRNADIGYVFSGWHATFDVPPGTDPQLTIIARAGSQERMLFAGPVSSLPR